MPKNKSHSGARKRFRVTGSRKKIMRRRANKNHLLEHKSGKQTRRLNKDAPLSRPDTNKLKSLIN